MQRISQQQMLIQLIKDRSTSMALLLITNLHATNTLDSLDDDGKSFLNHALEAGEKQIADNLLELQKENAQIIFGEDHMGKTPFALAIEHGYDDIAEKIIHLAKEATANTPGYKFWLEWNENGSTPLHVAVFYRRAEIATLLLEQISDENKKTIINIINRKNKFRMTALLLACESSQHFWDDELISLLIQHGADLGLKNPDGQSSFDFICKRNLDEQSHLLACLMKANAQEIFLNYYRKCVVQHRDDTELENNYRQLCEKRDLAIYQDTLQDALQEKIFDASTMDIEISSFLFAKENLDSFNSFKKESSSPEEYELFQQDEETLRKLINDFDSWLADLQTRPALWLSSKAVMGLIVAAYTFVYICIEVFFIAMAVTKRLDSVGAVMFGTLGLLPLFFIACLYRSYLLDEPMTNMERICQPILEKLEVPRKISNDEWNNTIVMIKAIQITLLEKLQLLEKNQQQDREGEAAIRYLPTDAQHIRALESNLAEFNGERKSVKEVIDMGERLQGTLKHIQDGMIISNKPFSMFHHQANDAVIEMEEDVLIHDESAALLGI